MKKLIAFLCLSAASLLAQSITTNLVDFGSGGNTGSNSSQAIVAGNPAVAYFNEDEGNLVFARNAATDGSGAWTITMVDSAGTVGRYPSLVVVDGTPAISYQDQSNGTLKFARNSAADGSGAWSIVTVDGAIGTVTDTTSLAVVGGTPAIAYYDGINRDLKFARNDAADGTGTWTLTTVAGTGIVGKCASLAVVDGNPAISFADDTTLELKFARNSAADGSGVWAIASVSTNAVLGTGRSLAIVAGNPAISYYPSGTKDLRYARNDMPDGSGTWFVLVVDPGLRSGQYNSLAVVDGKPAISYYDQTNSVLKFARAQDADGMGGWDFVTVDSPSVGSYTSLVVADGNPAITYYDSGNGNLKFARNAAADGSGAWTKTVADSGFQAGDVGRYSSHAIIDGHPAIAYYDSTNQDLRFARNAAADGSGAWTITTVDTAGDVGQFPALADADGTPVIAYYDSTNQDLKLARNAAPDGSGAWTITTLDAEGDSGTYASVSQIDSGLKFAVVYRSTDLAVDPPQIRLAVNDASDASGTWTISSIPTGQPGGAVADGDHLSLTAVLNNPAIAYNESGGGPLKFVRNDAGDGSATWTFSTVDVNGGANISLGVIAGNPALSYIGGSGELKFALNTAGTGDGTWVVSTVDSGVSVGVETSLIALGPRPVIAYMHFASGTMRLAHNRFADGTGTWDITTFDTNAAYSPSTAIVAGKVAVSYGTQSGRDLKWGIITYPQKIAVEEPQGTGFASGGTRALTAAIGIPRSLAFTLLNIGNLDLGVITVGSSGPNAADFPIITDPAVTLSGPDGTTSLVIRFAPDTPGAKTATFQISSNDDESPFSFTLNGTAVSANNDTDGDGLNDAAEVQLEALGFNWQAFQPDLVATLNANANLANLYTPQQVQALHVGTPLLTRNPANGQFTLTLGVKKAPDLVNFTPFPMTAPQTLINGQGKLEFTFGVPDNAAFFRIEAQ